jgi:hypothetical protein
MKNWKTTFIGIAAGAPIVIDALVNAYNDGYFTNKNGWQLAAAVAIIVLGAVLKDNVLRTGIGGSNPPAGKDEK